MYTMTLGDASQRMATNGRGGSAVARVITTPTITAVTPTSVTVTALTNVVAGDILILGTQGIWGVCTGVASNTASVKRWYGSIGEEGVVPAVSGSLSAYPSSVLGTAQKTKITGFSVSASTTTVTIRDVFGTTVAVPLVRLNTPVYLWGPWTAQASAATAMLSFETTGNLDT